MAVRSTNTNETVNSISIKEKRVFVGLSGGVDSGVTAALLKAQGAHVTGVFIKGWYPPGMPCTWAEDRRDAMRVAAHLGIPFLTLDAGKEYKQSVIDYLLREYRNGRTPNPDIMCNRDVKFGAFSRFAREKGADYIATGHYARLENGHLMRGKDEGKDQSYFLWAVSKETLSHTLFPLGGAHKEEVRRLARKYGLSNADKKDSVGICFLGDISIENFLKNEMDTTLGQAVDVEGELVGEHDGSVLYTLGERISLRNAAPGPWYVVRKDLAANTVTVTKEVGNVRNTGAIELSDTNWLEETSGSLEAQYRYHGPRISGTLSGNTFTPTSELPEPIASGQSLVLYTSDTCIGGGIIT
jgi:tRNA-uridine 2-sulfurtransferase